MHTQEAKFDIVSDADLDAVTGGRMNNGGQQLIHSPQDGVPGGGGNGNGDLLFGIAFGGEAGFILGAIVFA